MKVPAEAAHPPGTDDARELEDRRYSAKRIRRATVPRPGLAGKR